MRLNSIAGFLLTSCVSAFMLMSCMEEVSTDDISDKAPEGCKKMCSDFISCQFREIDGSMATEAEESADKACRAVCYWVTKEGTFATSEDYDDDDDDYTLRIEDSIEGEAVKNYVECLAAARVYSCDDGHYSIDGYELSESDCEDLDDCIAMLNIDLKARYDEDGEECVLEGSEFAWPHILSLYWDNED